MVLCGCMYLSNMKFCVALGYCVNVFFSAAASDLASFMWRHLFVNIFETATLLRRMA